MVLAALGHLTTSLGVEAIPAIGPVSPKEGGNRSWLGPQSGCSQHAKFSLD